jgi:hypothetical protein
VRIPIIFEFTYGKHEKYPFSIILEILKTNFGRASTIPDLIKNISSRIQELFEKILHYPELKYSYLNRCHVYINLEKVIYTNNNLIRIPFIIIGKIVNMNYCFKKLKQNDNPQGLIIYNTCIFLLRRIKEVYKKEELENEIKSNLLLNKHPKNNSNFSTVILTLFDS